MKRLRPILKLPHRGNVPRNINDTRRHVVCNGPVGQLRRCRDKLKAAQRGYREQLRVILQEVYFNVLELQRNPKAWNWFIADSFWDEHEGERPTAADQQDPWLFATMYVHQARVESKRKIASKHASVLWVLAQENTRAGSVSQSIKAQGGIQKLATRAAEMRSQLAGVNKSESTLTKHHLEPAGRSKNAKSETKSLKTPTSVEGTFYLAPDLAADLHNSRGKDVTMTARVLPSANGLRLEIIRVGPPLSRPAP